MVNNDCIRELLLFLDERLKPDEKGRKRKNVVLKKVVNDPVFSPYPKEDIYEAAKYIVEKGYVSVTKETKSNAPRWFSFTEVTAKGKDILPFLSSSSVWEKIRKALGNVFELSIHELTTAAINLGIGHLIG